MKLIRSISFTFIACVILILIFNSSSFATNYYVKNGGNDSADGKSDATAWKTIAKVNDFAKGVGFKDGDQINFKCGSIWSNDETLGNDGSPINWGKISGLTIQSYGTGAKPRFNGNTQRPIYIYDYDASNNGIVNLTIRDIDVSGGDWWNDYWMDGNIRTAYVTNQVFDGIYMNAHTGATKYMPVGGLYIGASFGDIEIKNCQIFNNIGKDQKLRSWLPYSPDVHSIILWSVQAGNKTEGEVIIHDNILHDVEGDCIQFGGILCPVSIYNNKMYHFGENALDFKGCNGVSIYNNEFYRGSYGLGGSGGGTGSIVFHEENISSCKNVVIRDNYFHTSDYTGIRLLHGTDVDIDRNYFKNITNGIQMVNNMRVNIHNNVFDLANGKSSSSALDAGIYVYPSYQLESKVYNNTFYLGTNHRYGMYITKSGVSVKNNIFYCARNNTDTYSILTSDNAKPTMDHNCYYNPNHTNRVNWNGVAYNSSRLQQFRNDIDPGAIFADPIFKNMSAGDFSLQATSPCILPSDIIIGALDASATDFLTMQKASASLSVPSRLRIVQ